MSDRRVLVVGTTPDYIAHIYNRYPQRALFLTDVSQRIHSSEAKPDDASEIVCSLSDGDRVLTALSEHLNKWRQSLSGVSCYDCEWLGMAAALAERFGLPFPNAESVRLCRNKYQAKQRWTECGVRCPRASLIGNGRQATQFIEQLGRPIVLKPLTGTGSELTFRCDDGHEAAKTVRVIRTGLRQRSKLPLYQPDTGRERTLNPELPVLAEEFVEGREYSADFIIHGDNVFLIRVAKKLRDHRLPFGTTLAYVIPAKLPGRLNYEVLSVSLREAAKALGLTRAVCMADFIMSQDEILFLELTPRIGGDCLPFLIRRSCGLDTVGLALDFAEGQECNVPSPDQWKELVGMRLFASRRGVLSGMNLKVLSEDSRVREILLKRAPGHKIALPPEDYDSWLLGHVIFEPLEGVSLRNQCDDLKKKIVFNVEQCDDQKLAWFRNAGSRVAQSAGPST